MPGSDRYTELWDEQHKLLDAYYQERAAVLQAWEESRGEEIQNRLQAIRREMDEIRHSGEKPCETSVPASSNSPASSSPAS